MPKTKRISSRSSRSGKPEPRIVATPKSLGEIVRAERIATGFDQATAAGLVGVGVRFFGDIERGKPTVRFGLVLRVLDRLGLELVVSTKSGVRGP